MTRYFALLPAAGTGARMGLERPKQYLDLRGRPMIWHALRAFDSDPRIDTTFAIIAKDDGWWDRFDWSEFNNLVVKRAGAATRAGTVLNGLKTIREQVLDDDWILVHDAARPCISRRMLDKLMLELADDPVGGILATAVADTLKREDGTGRIAGTVHRERIWAAQTPQMFRYVLLRRALEQAGTMVTDEASAIESIGLFPRLVEGDRSNLKVTFRTDLEMAAWILGR